MTSDPYGSPNESRRISPADVRNVRFTRTPRMRSGYDESEVDRFAHRMAAELDRLYAEKAAMRDHMIALQAQADEAAVEVPPSDQAVRLLATAQQTADNYVAEAEDFSRQMTTDARAQYEEKLRLARDKAGAIIEAAQEAATRIVGGTSSPAADTGQRSTEELEEQVAYLKAFGQAVRVQLRSYLEALLTDVEAEWGRADPASLPKAPIRTPAQRSGPASDASRNVAREMPLSDSTSEHRVVTTDGEVEVLGPRK